MKKNIHHFKNFYCDMLDCALSKYINFDEDKREIIEKNLDDNQLSILADYVVEKNKKAGVKQLMLKVPKYGIGIKSIEKYGLDGKEILSCKDMFSLPSKAFVGDRILFEIDDILNFSQKELYDIVDLLATMDASVLVKLGQNLEEVGKIVNRYNSSPVEVLESFGILDRKCYIYGLNFIDKDDQKLLNNYGTKLIFSPRSDAQQGLGAINLYNFIYNGLKFCFSSGKCYNIDMLAECKMARNNTSNLMYDNSLISYDDLIQAVMCYADNDELLIDFDEDELKDNIFDKKIDVEVEDFDKLEEKVKEIVTILKEKI